MNTNNYIPADWFIRHSVAFWTKKKTTSKWTNFGIVQFWERLDVLVVECFSPLILQFSSPQFFVQKRPVALLNSFDRLNKTCRYYSNQLWIPLTAPNSQTGFIWLSVPLWTWIDDHKVNQGQQLSFLCMNGWPIGGAILSNDFRRSNLLNTFLKTTCSVAGKLLNGLITVE